MPPGQEIGSRRRRMPWLFSRRLLTGSLFTNHIFCRFVSSQSQEDRLPKLVVASPLGKLDLSDQHRFHPAAAFDHCWVDALTPAPSHFLRQVYKGASLTSDFLQAMVEDSQHLFCEAGADSTGKKESVRTIVTDEQRTEVHAAAFGRRVSADNKLLLRSQLAFDPSPAAPSAFVDTLRPFCDQAFELELPCNLEKVISVAVQLLGEPNIVRGFLQQLGKQLPSFDERSRAQIGSLEVEQVEGVIDERGSLTASVRLEELERGSPILIKRSDLSVDNHVFRG